MISEGDVAFVDYGEVPPCVHTRLVASHIMDDLYVIITPDHDIYEEQLSQLNPDLVAFWPGGAGLGMAPPPGVNPAHVYGFRPMTAIEYQRLMQMGRTYAAGLRTRLGVNVAPQVPVAAAAAAAPVNPMVWVALESRGSTKQGSIVIPSGQALPPGSSQVVDRAIVVGSDGKHLCLKQIEESKVATMEGRDLRVLPLHFDIQGQRRMEFSEAVARMTHEDMPGGELQLEGPASSLEVLKAMVQRGLTPVTDHEHWMRTSDISRSDRSIYEMEVITRTIEAFAITDQLNIPNLKGCELLLRRRQQMHCGHPGLATAPKQGTASSRPSCHARLEKPGSGGHQAPPGLAYGGAVGLDHGSEQQPRGGVGRFAHVRHVHAARRSVHPPKGRLGPERSLGPHRLREPSPLRGRPVDSKEAPWLGRALQCISSVPLAPLLPTNYQQLTQIWKDTLSRLHLPKNYAVLHQLRHSGASWDRYKDYRSALDVKLRGRWQSDKTLKRYEQHALVAQHFEKLPEETKQRATAAPSLLQSMVLGQRGLLHE